MPLTAAQRTGPHRQFSHVQRAADPIEDRQRNQQQKRGNQVGGDVVQAGGNAQLARAVQHQPVGGRQQDFKKDKEVKQIAGQKRAVQPHQQQLVERQKVDSGAFPAHRRIREHRAALHRAQHQHDGRQPVGDKHDAKRGGPVAQQVYGDVLRPVFGQRACCWAGYGVARAACRYPQQHQRHRQLGDGGDPRQRQPRAVAAVAQQQQEGAGQQRNDHRQDGYVLQQRWQRQQRPHHTSASRPSTWSLPDSPREASSSTRKSAVVAKPMTMAVSTSACGTGSVYRLGSMPPA